MQEIQTISDFVVRLNAVVTLLENKTTQSTEQLLNSSTILTKSVEQCGEKNNLLISNIIEILKKETTHTLTSSSNQVISEFNQKLNDSAHSIVWVAKQLEDQRKSIEKQRRSLFWVSFIALIISSILAAGGSSWMAWKNMEEIKRAEFSKEILDATRKNKITLCGKDLCVKIEKKPKFFGQHKEYVLVEK